MADKSKALSDCRTCHRAGSQAFQSVTISLVGPDGRRVGYGANADVLNSAFSVDSVSGFYAIGGTRIKLLDILLVLAIFGGGGIAVGHVFLGWMFKRFGLYHPHNGNGHPPAAAATRPSRPPDRASEGKGTAPCDSISTRCRSASGTGPMRSALS